MKTQTPSKTPAKSKNLKYWRERGSEDAWYQRQAQTTWWSVLGGIAIGIIVTQINLVIASLKTPQWYTGLYCVATLLVIAYSWVQTSWGSLVMKWPITILGSLCVMLSNISLAFAALNLSNPLNWMISLTVAALSSFFIQLNFFRSGSWDVFPKEKQRGYKTSLFAYAGLVVVVAGFTVHMALVPTHAVFILYGIVSVVISIGLLVWQHMAMETEKSELGIP